MSEGTYGEHSGRTDGGLVRGVLGIVITGVVLGLAYNWIGLRSQPDWGLPWLAEDRAEMAQLEGISGQASPTPSVVSDDPMAVSDDPMAVGGSPEASAGLPEIPDLGRPIQVQLPAVRRFHEAGAAYIVDARDREEYLLGHIEGAVNLPVDQAITDPARLESLDTGGRPIITYCGGGECEISINLAHALVSAGHSKVLVFMGGYPEWIAAGYPIGTGDPEGR